MQALSAIGEAVRESTRRFPKSIYALGKWNGYQAGSAGKTALPEQALEGYEMGYRAGLELAALEAWKTRREEGRAASLEALSGKAC